MSTPTIIEAGQPRGLRIDLARARQGHAELVLGEAGGNLGVGLGVDVRIDAQRDMGALPVRRRNPEMVSSSGSELDIEAEDALVERGAISSPVLPTPEKVILPRDAGGARAGEFAARHHVHAGADFGEQGEHRLIGVGLHRIADQRVEPLERRPRTR